jgi:hypothetical protein
MRLSLPWTISGTIGLSLLALPLGVLVVPRSRAQTNTAPPAWVVPWPSTPYQTAMREAGFWRAQAIQLAADERDEEQETLQDWDPAARFDAKRELRRFLAADDRGYLKRALAALQNAERLAPTPAESAQARRFRRNWEVAAHPAGWRA